MSKGIVMQPGSGGPQSNALEFLSGLDFIKIRQKVDIAELFTPWEVKNRYEVCDRNDLVFMTVTEESDTCERMCCYPVQRGLILHVQDMNGQELAHIRKNFKCCAGGSCCASICQDGCAMEMWVDSPVGNLSSHIRQMYYCCFPKFEVIDKYGKQSFTLTGPCCPCQGPGCYAELEYPMSTSDGMDAGARVTKIWDGAGRACCTHANTFGCYFPRDMDVHKKLSIFGSAFVLDYLLFENNGQDG